MSGGGWKSFALASRGTCEVGMAGASSLDMPRTGGLRDVTIGESLELVLDRGCAVEPD